MIAVIRLFLVSLLFTLPIRAEITVSGSDLAETVLSKIADNYKKATGESVKLNLAGTNKGFQEIESGKCDLAILAIPLGKEPPKDRKSIAFVNKVTVVAVSSSNSLEKISSQQLSRIFSQNKSDQIKYWYELGGLSGSREIQPAVYRGNDTIGDQLFQNMVLSDGSFSDSVRIFYERSKLLEYPKQTVNAIVLYDQVPGDVTGVRIIPVYNPADEKSYLPTESNVAQGLYPYRLPFYLVYPESSLEKVSDFLQYLFSAEALTALKQDGFIILPENMLQEYRFGLRVKK